jgi:hypothetical protein
VPQVGFEPTIPVLEWAKTVHASDRAAPVIDQVAVQLPQLHLQLHEAESFVEASSYSASQNKLPNLYGTRTFVMCSQQPAIGPNLEAD